MGSSDEKKPLGAAAETAPLLEGSAVRVPQGQSPFQAQVVGMDFVYRRAAARDKVLTGRADDVAVPSDADRAWEDPPLAIAHRGFRARFPENTMVAFQEAIAVGAEALETDLHLSKDKVVVLSHVCLPALFL